MRGTIARVAFLLALLGTAAATSTSFRMHAQDVKPQPVAVSIDNFSFTPKEIVIPKGTTVTWTNRDDVPHTVTSTDQKFRSKALDTDEQFSFTFTESGTYAYFCSVHPMMTGKVIVQ
jgi:plastocyanin